MELKIKIFLLATFVCAFIGLYNIVSAEAPANKGESMPMIGGISVEAAEPNVIMPSPVHVFTTVQSVITLEKDILQVVYVYGPGAEPYYNKASGALIIYRSSKLAGDISGDHKIHKVIETERVDGTKVTFKGSKKKVYLASWMKDGQNHSLEFQHPITRDMAKAIIRNIVEEKSHTK